jgi:hypothetical protein
MVMITIQELNKIYIEKLIKTGSYDAAFTKATWIAFKAGIEVGILQALEEIKNEQSTDQSFR